MRKPGVLSLAVVRSEGLMRRQHMHYVSPLRLRMDNCKKRGTTADRVCRTEGRCHPRPMFMAGLRYVSLSLTLDIVCVGCRLTLALAGIPVLLSSYLQRVECSLSRRTAIPRFRRVHGEHSSMHCTIACYACDACDIQAFHP